MALTERDILILRHIGLYRLTLRNTLERLFFDGKSSGNVIQRLSKEGWIISQSGLPAKISYYQLSSKAVRHLGLPINRATHLGNQALHTALATLWFCCMSPTPRIRLEESDLINTLGILPPGAPQSPYCVEVQQVPRIYRIRVCAPNSSVENITKTLRQNIRSAINCNELAPWITHNNHAIIVLGSTPSRCQAILAAAKNAQLTELMTIESAVVPSHDTLPMMLEELSKNSP